MKNLIRKILLESRQDEFIQNFFDKIISHKIKIKDFNELYDKYGFTESDMLKLNDKFNSFFGKAIDEHYTTDIEFRPHKFDNDFVIITLNLKNKIDDSIITYVTGWVYKSGVLNVYETNFQTPGIFRHIVPLFRNKLEDFFMLKIKNYLKANNIKFKSWGEV